MWWKGSLVKSDLLHITEYVCVQVIVLILLVNRLYCFICYYNINISSQRLYKSAQVLRVRSLVSKLHCSTRENGSVCIILVNDRMDINKQHSIIECLTRFTKLDESCLFLFIKPIITIYLISLVVCDNLYIWNICVIS